MTVLHTGSVFVDEIRSHRPDVLSEMRLIVVYRIGFYRHSMPASRGLDGLLLQKLRLGLYPSLSLSLSLCVCACV